MLALALLCALQYAVAFASVRSERFQALVKAEPSLLYYRGEFLTNALRSERVTKEEILAAVRGNGIAKLSAVDAVVLETDGSFSVVSGADSPSVDSLRYVQSKEDVGSAV